MKILGKPLKGYLEAIGTPLLLVLLITVAQLPLFLLEFYPHTAIDPLGLLKIVFVGWAGWIVVRRHKFGLKQTTVVGLMLFMATIWFLPLVLFSFPSNPFVPRILILVMVIIINLSIYILVAIFGGWLARRVGG